MKRNIAILTQPLHDNYGGLLQAFALSKSVSQYGEVLIINRWGGHNSITKRFISGLKQIIIKNPNLPSKAQKEIISQHTSAFRKKYIPNLSHNITSDEGMKELINKGFDTYIVGSDQCWRPRYSPNITNYFLDFIENKQNVTRISYAASFGTSDWEFNEPQTKICRDLIQKFDAVSVREDSGIRLCKNYLNKDALHFLDPTMLLDKDDYKAIIENEGVGKSKGNLKVYVLDRSEEKNKIIQYLSKTLKLKPFEILPVKQQKKEKITDENVGDFIYPSPAEWIRGFQDSEFVITDSFHGTAFSILHNLPFIAIGNTRRGLARFESLLQMFGLEDKLLLDFEEEKADEILKQEINWAKVNETLNKEREKAKQFLKSYLI